MIEKERILKKHSEFITLFQTFINTHTLNTPEAVANLGISILYLFHTDKWEIEDVKEYLSDLLITYYEMCTKEKK